jgi:hypothetical protein
MFSKVETHAAGYSHIQQRPQAAAKHNVFVGAQSSDAHVFDRPPAIERLTKAPTRTGIE